MGEKTFKTFQEQAERLIENGCVGDVVEIKSKLASINYYRLSAYWYPFRKQNPNYDPAQQDSRPKLDQLIGGTKFQDIVALYDFDHALKTHVFKAIERIEVALRTKTAYYWCAFRKKKTNAQEELDSDFLEEIQKLYQSSKDECVKHQKNAYNISHVKNLPVWVFVELTTFTHLQRIYKSFEEPLRIRIANEFGFKTINSFQSSVSLVKEARNVCAHYGRFWNKSWTVQTHSKGTGTSVKTPLLRQTTFSDILKYSWNETNKTWETTSNPKNKQLSLSKTASLLVIIAEIDKKITGSNKWAEELVSLIKTQKPDTSLNLYEEMGLIGDWGKHPAFLQ